MTSGLSPSSRRFIFSSSISDWGTTTTCSGYASALHSFFDSSTLGSARVAGELEKRGELASSVTCLSGVAGFQTSASAAAAGSKGSLSYSMASLVGSSNWCCRLPLELRLTLNVLFLLS